jgi:hypothetical protein
MGHLLKIKCVDSRVNVHILASVSVPYTLTSVQVPNLALTHTKWITVYICLRNGVGNTKERGIYEYMYFCPYSSVVEYNTNTWYTE